MNTSGNPFSEIKKIETSQELLDIAFTKAMKIKPPSGKNMGPFERSKSHEANRINTAANVLTDRIERIVKQFPSLNQIHPFYLEIIEIFDGMDDLKRNLGKIYGTIDLIRSIESSLIKIMNENQIKLENKKIRREAFGRFSSIIYDLKDQLLELEEIRKKLIDLPSFNPTFPCVVICGIPNAGKSSFIKITTSGKPEVASYPFTTKKIIFGHRKLSFFDIQFVDTPGILDRSLPERNKIELQALAALKYLADVMVFLIDLSNNATSSFQSQLNLLKEIKNYYSSSEFIISFSKSDIIKESKIEDAISYLIQDNLISRDTVVPIFNVRNEDSARTLINSIENIIQNKILKNDKFKILFSPEIDIETLPLQDDPEYSENYLDFL